MTQNKLKRIKLYILLYWNTFLSHFQRREKTDVFIYEDKSEVEQNTDKKD
jgi:hypothetical protein